MKTLFIESFLSKNRKNKKEKIKRRKWNLSASADFLMSTGLNSELFPTLLIAQINKKNRYVKLLAVQRHYDN